MTRAAALAAGAAAALLAFGLGALALRGDGLGAGPGASPARAASKAPSSAGVRDAVAGFARADASAPAAPLGPASAPALAALGLGPLPASLAGTDPAGGLRSDASGRFVPGPEALALFDYYFSAAGEEPDEALPARIRVEIRRRLPPAAAAEAEALLERVLAYRAGAEELFATDLSQADPERRFQRIRELRRSVFGAELAAAVFGEDETVTVVDLERRRVAEPGDLAPAERERQLAALDARLPEPEREARAAARAALELRAAEAALRMAGADDSAIAAERERRVGPEAAARLAALDAQRSAWNERVAAYRATLDALRAEGRAPADEAAALGRVRDERFEGPERLRIDALDRIEAGEHAPEPSPR